MSRLAILVLVLSALGCGPSATTGSGDDSATPDGIGLSPRAAAEAAAAEAEARKAATRALIGRWLSVGDNEAPGYHPGYDFRPDATWVPVTQGGQPIPKQAGGTWSVSKCRREGRGQALVGELEMRGAPTEQVQFQLDNETDLRLLVPSHKTEGRLIPLMFRRSEQ
ncbi:MAG TPA: hypothetical protein VKD90_21365 [Gemmataceae bacterium]|nr:hypothetical protein [Gemmataceae bacterium]